MTYAILVFIAMYMVDMSWGRYVQHAAAGNRMWAAGWSIPITGLSGLVTMSFVEQPLMLIPACLGAFVGTLHAIRKQ